MATSIGLGFLPPSVGHFLRKTDNNQTTWNVMTRSAADTNVVFSHWFTLVCQQVCQGNSLLLLNR